MKIIKEKFDNFPDKTTITATAVEGQALEDTAEFDKRKNETDKAIEKQTKLPVDGAPKALKPEAVKIPNALTESFSTTDEEINTYLNQILEIYPSDEIVNKMQSQLGNDEFYTLLVKIFGDEIEPVEESFISGMQEDSSKSSDNLNENINDEDAARIVQEVLRNSFGINAEIESYKDDQSKATIVQFVISKQENSKVIYDEFKEELYKRFNHNVNISCKTFSSPNLEEHRVEYKIKVLVIKEKKDKWGASKSIGKTSQNQRESLIVESANDIDDSLELFDLLWNDLAKDTDHEYRRIPAINADLAKKPYMIGPLYPNAIRYKAEDADAPMSDLGVDTELGITEDGNIKITPHLVGRKQDGVKNFDFAKHVAEVYSDYGVDFYINDELDKNGNEYGIMVIPEEWLGKDTTEQEERWQAEMKAKKKEMSATTEDKIEN